MNNWKKIDDLMYMLLHHNKNYTSEQYNGLLELEELLNEMKPKEEVKESSLYSKLKEATSLKESSGYENVLDRVVEIEDYNGNTFMAFETDNSGNIIRYSDCDVADVDADYIFDTDKDLIRIQKHSGSTNESQSLKEAGNGSYIIKTVDWESDPIKADSEAEAMDIFANEFDNDLNTYFKAISQNLNEREEERSWSDDGKYLNIREMVARALENNIHDKEFTDEEIEQIFAEVVDNDQSMEEIYMEIENQALEAAKKYRGE